jgi:single-strand DNA-binding protein
MPDNSVTLVGNVTREPELRYTAAGQAMAKFGLAVNRRWQNRQTNAWEESTSFFDVVAWREMAENVGESITKGTRVVVTGRMEQRSYENQAGEKRSAVELVADEIGPSLRWATAKVVRNERRSDGDGGGYGGGGGQAGGGGAERQPAAAAPRYEDEEPF